MSLINRPNFNLVENSLANVTDLGDYYAAGSMILNKDLSLTSLSKSFNLKNPNGNYIPNNSFTSFRPEVKQCHPLNLKGSGSMSQGVSGRGWRNIWIANDAAFFDGGKFGNYWDSTSGETSGLRYIVVQSSHIARNESPYSFLNIGIVDAEGDVNWITKNPYYGDQHGGKVYIFAESDTHLFGYLFAPIHGDKYAQTFFDIDKVSGSTGVYYSNHQYNNVLEYMTVTYCGETNDHKHWFLLSPRGDAHNIQPLYAVIDTVYRNVGLTRRIETVPVHATNKTTGSYKPSQFSYYSNSNKSKFKQYVISDKNSVGSELEIKMLTVDSYGVDWYLLHNHTPDYATYKANDPITCQLTTSKVYNQVYNSVNNGDISVEGICYTFEDNNNEYLVVVYKSAFDASNEGYIYGFDRCDISNHRVLVFSIDPVDPSKLIEVSNLEGTDLTTTKLSICLRSVDGKTIVVGNSQGYSVLSWNSALKRFSKGDWVQIENCNLHLDISNQLWIRNFKGEVYVFPINQTLTINVDFDVQTATYSGQPLTINALVDAYDSQGLRVVTNVQLNVSGGKFAGNTNTISVTTSAIQATQVPITVSSYGSLIVTPSI